MTASMGVSEKKAPESSVPALGKACAKYNARGWEKLRHLFQAHGLGFPARPVRADRSKGQRMVVSV